MRSENRDHLFLDEIPLMLPVIPTIDVVVFPHMVVPLLILDEKIIKGIEQALQSHKKILLLAAQQHTDGYQGPIGIQDLYRVGTVGNIMRVMNVPEGGIKILTQGVCRARVEQLLSEHEQLQAQINIVEQEVTEEGVLEQEEQVKRLVGIIDKITSSGRMFSPDFQAVLSQLHDPERIADFVLSHLNLDVATAQKLLEYESCHELLKGLCDFLTREQEMSHVQERIKTNTRDSINRSQREYYLREQLKAIQKELGEEGDSDLDELKQKLHSLPLTQEAYGEASRQMRRLERTSPDSMEATVLRNHLDYLLNMPWGVVTKDNIDINHAAEVLDKNHYGLDDIKDRILDFLSVRFLKQDCKTPILCLAGPPGVGKTSLGRSIADALGRNYFRISLGGVYDESEIRGHRRTYVGALPGRFVQAIRKAGSCNPVIIIDEIDKLGMSNRGDPSAALLEVLDPEQNQTFYDNYLGVHFDLSKVMFIATANDLSAIPGPLRDRMEIVQISGYTHEEKLQIARQHLVEKAISNAGLENRGVVVSDPMLAFLIEKYTREAGVRELDRMIQKLCSKYARSLVSHQKKIDFDVETIHTHLGPWKNGDENMLFGDKVGVTNGLAWTPFGGSILQVEAVLMPGSGKLILTGQLGDVIKESAQAALSYVKSNSQDFGIAPEMFTSNDLHIHLPAGAVPKDGPSAGISLLSSVLSAYTKRAIRGSYAMTGEVSLHGHVLPIGGLKEKILAAKQHGLLNIIIPRSNEKDLAGLQRVYEGLQIFFVDHVNQVLEHVLMPHLLTLDEKTSEKPS